MTIRKDFTGSNGQEFFKVDSQLYLSPQQ